MFLPKHDLTDVRAVPLQQFILHSGVRIATTKNVHSSAGYCSSMSSYQPVPPASARIDSPTVPREHWVITHESPNSSERSRFAKACDTTFRLDVGSPSTDKPIAATLVTFEDVRRSQRFMDLVIWDGDDDPQDPRNWRGWEKAISTGVVLLMCGTQ